MSSRGKKRSTVKKAASGRKRAQLTSTKPEQTHSSKVTRSRRQHFDDEFVPHADSENDEDVVEVAPTALVPAPVNATRPCRAPHTKNQFETPHIADSHELPAVPDLSDIPAPTPLPIEHLPLPLPPQCNRSRPSIANSVVSPLLEQGLRGLAPVVQPIPAYRDSTDEVPNFGTLLPRNGKANRATSPLWKYAYALDSSEAPEKYSPDDLVALKSKPKTKKFVGCIRCNQPTREGSRPECVSNWHQFAILTNYADPGLPMLSVVVL